MRYHLVPSLPTARSRWLPLPEPCKNRVFSPRCFQVFEIEMLMLTEIESKRHWRGWIGKLNLSDRDTGHSLIFLCNL